MKKSILILASGCFLLLTSCNPKYYTANTQNVPLISQKGETNLTLAGNANQVEAQGAYGITKNIALQANGGLFIPGDLDNGNGGSGRFLELGAGYYKPLENNLVFEVYGLLGMGAVENHLPSTVADYPSTKGDISASMFRYGIQPNIGYKSKHFSVAVSSRFVNMNYSNIKGDLIFDNQSQVAYLESNKSNFLVEPAITIKGGLDKIKLQLQYGYSLNLSNSSFTQDKTWFTIGLNFNFK